MDISIKKYSELTSQQQTAFYDDNDLYLVIEWDDGTVQIESDGMEPEDVRFCRDLSWVKEAIARAYGEGIVRGCSTQRF